nr:MAG TPA: hypothetical protein [Caudoviricetes sp.]
MVRRFTSAPVLPALVLYILSPLYVRIKPNCTAGVTK